MKLGRYEVPVQIVEIVEQVINGSAGVGCFFQRNGIFYVSYVCDLNFLPLPTIHGEGHTVWLALNPTVRRLRVNLRARYRNGHIGWGPSRSLKIFVRGSDLTIRDGIAETHRAARHCKYGEWSQYFSCKSTGKEGVVTQCADQEMEAHFAVLCPHEASRAKARGEDDPITMSSRKDIFLSHVSADKKAVVRPFARVLDDQSITYWLDEAEIAWGDNLVQKINEGLANSVFVVVFVSLDFADRPWPLAELSSALSQQMATGIKRVLPVIVGDTDAVLAKLPMLRGFTYEKWDPASSDDLAEKLKDLLASP